MSLRYYSVMIFQTSNNNNNVNNKYFTITVSRWKKF